MIISLSRGLTTIIDDADWELVKGRVWVVVTNSGGRQYAGCRQKVNGRWVTELMHRTILGITDNTWVDHVNGNGLDNRRQNLRHCTPSQNLANSRLRRDNKSGAKGVVWSARQRRWQANIRHNGRRLHLGTFRIKEDAIRAYNKAAVSIFGEFARVNPI